MIAKKGGYGFDRNERADELEEMNNGGVFTDIELDAAAMEVLFAHSREQEQKGKAGCWFYPKQLIQRKALQA